VVSTAVAVSQDLKRALLSFAAAVLLTAALGLVGRVVPLVGENIGALVAMVFLFIPYVVGSRYGEDLVDYGFRFSPLRKGLLIAGIPLLILMPLYAVGFVLFYNVACQAGSPLAPLAPPHQCLGYHGWEGAHLPQFDVKLTEWLLAQLIVTALPEELFFRGYLLKLFERVWPPRRRLAGGGLGVALLVSSALFALVHLILTPYPYRLFVFFPALVFGWMYSATGSILAGTLTHFASNVAAHLLELILFV
jgi:membrane protease YdiL (CAAX protease family)